MIARNCSGIRRGVLNLSPEGPRHGSVVAPYQLAVCDRSFHARTIFVVTEDEAEATRAAFHQGGLAAAVELCRRFPDTTDNAQARACERTIAGWTPLNLPPRPPVRRCKRSSGQ
jgi:hypothetical protein